MSRLAFILSIMVAILISGIPAGAKTASDAASVDAADAGITPSDDIVYEGTGEAVVFSHTAHVDGFGLECDSCHPKIFEPKAYSAQKKGDFTMKSLGEGKYCGACHDGQMAFSAADFEQCARCHMGRGKAMVTGKPVTGPKDAIILGAGDSVAEFRHSSHESFSCSDCHTGLFPMKKTATITTMDDINNGKTCGSCHNGKTAPDTSNCAMCHPKM